MPDHGFADDKNETPSASLLTRRTEAVVVASILLVALGVRAFNLNNEAAWYDEIVTVSLLDSPTLSEFLSRCQELSPVAWFNVYEVTEYVWARVIGSSVASIRVLSILYGLGSLVALYAFARSLFSTRAALLALSWTVFMPWHIYFSQEIRFYSLVALFSILSMHSLVQVTRTGSTKWIAVNFALNFLLVWTHIATAFLLVAQGLFLLLTRLRKRTMLAIWAGVNGAMALHAYASQPAFEFDNLDKLVGWIPKPDVVGDAPSVASYLKLIAGHSFGVNDLRPFTAWGEALYPAYPVLKWLLTFVALAAIGVAIWRMASSPTEASEPDNSELTQRQRLYLLALWFFVPPFCAFVGSYALRPMFVERYVIYAAFPVYVLIGYGLSRARSAWIPAAALAIPLAMYAAFQFPGPYRVPFDRIIDTIESNAHDGDVVLTENTVIYTGLSFYAQGRDVKVLSPAASTAFTEQRAQGYFWLLVINPGEQIDYDAGALEVAGTWIVDAMRAAHLRRMRWTATAKDGNSP